MKVLKKKIKKYLPNKLILLYRRFIQKKIYLKEEKRRYGVLNQDKKIYIIRRTPPAAGLMSNFGMVLLHLLEAKEKNMIPVIDYENYNSFYQETEAINGTKNMWEYYWKQPNNITLKEAYQSMEVILSKEKPNQKSIWTPEFLNDNEYIKKLYNISQKVPLNEETSRYIELVRAKLIPKNKKILGVAVRGTDYLRSGDNYGHPIQPTKQEILDIVKEKYYLWEADYIFLRTEEEETIKIFEEEFGEKVLYTKMDRFKNYNQENSIPIVKEKLNTRKNDNYLKGLEYLTEIYILSSCNFLIAASNSGVAAAVILNGNKFEEKYIINKGVYKNLK